METLRVKQSAVRVRFMPQASRPTGRSECKKSRLQAATLYRHLDLAFNQYTHDVPEDSFPTFLESLLLEHLAEDRPRGAHPRDTASNGVLITVLGQADVWGG